MGLLCFLLVLTTFLAKAHTIPLHSISNITQAALYFPKPLVYDDIYCFPQPPSHQPQPPSLVHADCIVILYQILLSPDVGKYQIWSSITPKYPRIHDTCRISLDHNPELHKPQDEFREYQIAISAALVLHHCESLNYGGFAYLTQNEQFIVDVRRASALGEGDTNALLLGTKNITNEPAVTSDLVLPLASDIVALSKISTTNLSFSMPVCISQQPHIAHPASVVAEGCYVIFYLMFVNPDILTNKTWSGLFPSGRWVGHRNCVVSLLGYSPDSRASFTLMDVQIAAARIVQACVVGQHLPWGGTMDVGNGNFFVKVVGSEQGVATLNA